MSDLISRQALINKAEYEAEAMAEPFKSQLPVLVAWLAEKMPSEEPERKTAEWVYGENDGQDGWYCSKCGLFIPWDYEYYGLDNIDFIADFHTCPKCDSKMLKYTSMRGEQDEIN